LTSKDCDNFSIKEFRIIEKVQTLIDSTDKYQTAYQNIISIQDIGQINAIALRVDNIA